MPCKTSNCYSITFRPKEQEFKQYQSEFTRKFLQKYKDNKYIISPEHGEKKDLINHFQIYLEIDKVVRSDTFRKSFKNCICKEMTLSHLNTAVYINPITRDGMYQMGYCLKEQNQTFSDVITTYTLDQLAEFRDYYEDSKRDQSAKENKRKVNLRTLPEIFRQYIDMNIGWLRHYEYIIIKEKETKDDDDEFRVVLVKPILLMMGQEDYHMIPILNSRDREYTFRYLLHYYNGTLRENHNVL